MTSHDTLAHALYGAPDPDDCPCCGGDHTPDQCPQTLRAGEYD